MSDTRYAKVERCVDCPEFANDLAYCTELKLFMGDGYEQPPDCPLLHLRDIPEVRALVKSSKEILSSPFKVDLKGGFVEIRVSLKHNNDLGDAIKPFEEGE